MSKLCVIFDLDGTLVDSEPLCNQAFLDLLPDLKDSLRSLVSRYRGRRLVFILEDLAIRLGRSLPDDFERQYRERVAELMSRNLRFGFRPSPKARPSPGSSRSKFAARKPWVLRTRKVVNSAG